MPFLALISLKDWMYGGIIAAILAGFGWYTYHERAVEHAKDMIAVQNTTKIAVALNNKVATAEAAALTPIGVEYHEKLAAPPVADIGLVCHDSVRSSPVPAAAEGGRPDDAAAHSEQGPPFDPSGAALTRGAKADAQITALQDTIKVLVKAQCELAKVKQCQFQ